jgi:XTP/dITP diphosphohydrolase
VWSARYAGYGASDEENLLKLLLELDGVAPGRRSARYRCVIALVRERGDPAPLIAHGSWEGSIALAPCGRGGFGYDPIFVPTGATHSAAEMSATEKNAVSHRAQALAGLLAQLS